MPPPSSSSHSNIKIQRVSKGLKRTVPTPFGLTNNCFYQRLPNTEKQKKRRVQKPPPPPQTIIICPTHHMERAAAGSDASGHSSNHLLLMRRWHSCSSRVSLAGGGVLVFQGDLGTDRQDWVGRFSRHTHHIHLNQGRVTTWRRISSRINQQAGRKCPRFLRVYCLLQIIFPATFSIVCGTVFERVGRRPFSRDQPTAGFKSRVGFRKGDAASFF